MPALRVTHAGVVHRQHAIRAEVAEVATQLAPGSEQAHVRQERHRKRPDHPLAGAAFGIGVLHAYGVLLADRKAQRRKPRLLRNGPPVRREQATGFHLQARRLR